VSTVTVQGSRSPCVELVPASWRDDVPGAPVPAARTDNDALAALKEWVGFGVAESGQREKANLMKREGFALIERCTARDVAVDQAMRKKWWQVWK
jgi:hypothetical protein